MLNSQTGQSFFTAELEEHCLDLLTNDHTPLLLALCAGSVLGVHRHGDTT